MEYSKKLLNFIERNKALINNNEFDKIYNKLKESEEESISNVEVEFTYLMIAAGIDILNYITKIPDYFLYNMLYNIYGEKYPLQSDPYLPKIREMILNLNKYPNIKSIGESAFRYFPINSKLSLSNLKEIGWFAFDHAGITELEINNVGTIGQSSFSSNDSLETLIIDGAKDVRWEFVHYSYRLKTVVLKNIDLIRETAFEKSAKEECKIYIANTVHKIRESAFRGTGDNVTIYCEAKEKPKGWEEGWDIKYGSKKHKVIWGYKSGL